MSGDLRRLVSMTAGALSAFGIGIFYPVDAQQPEPATSCRITGRATSGDVPLPGVSLVVRSGETVRLATSTDLEGRFVIVLPSNGTYQLSADLLTFGRVEREVITAAQPCDAVVDVWLALRPRTETVAPIRAVATAADAVAQPGAGAGPGGGRGRGGGQGRGGENGRGFQRLTVEQDSNNSTLVAAEPDNADAADADLQQFLPSGFTGDSVQADAITISGSNDATSLDRRAMNDRTQTIGRGGPGDFVIGGRGGRGPRLYSGNANYTFGGSAFDAAPYQLRPDVSVKNPNFARNNFGVTFGGPIRIPGIYEDTDRRSNFQLNYSGSRSNNIFDQYATVPTEQMRAGDFSFTNRQLVNPATGQPFGNNQIPQSVMNAGSLELLKYIPLPNLTGTRRNYHTSTTSNSISDSLNVRITQNLSPSQPQRGGGRGGTGRGAAAPQARGGGGGRGGGPGGRGGGGRGRGTTIMLNAQVQYRRNNNDALNVFSDLSGVSSGTNLSVPLGLNIQKGRAQHSVNVGYTHATANLTNAFTAVENVAAEAGIQYPDAASLDPLNWGVPNISISGFTGLRSAAANRRVENRWTVGYSWSHPVNRHQLRLGADWRSDVTSSETNSNARGTFTFTGLYTGLSQVAGSTGAGFADFLLGAPQQATVQVAGLTKLRDRSVAVYFQDNWQTNARLTVNLGLRYELNFPYTEASGRMANLDVNQDFTAASAVIPGETGTISGHEYPSALINTDFGNAGPRVGVAYRLAPQTFMRGGYSITYNNGSYASIARRLVAQPPFSSTQTVIAEPFVPLLLQDALLSSTATTTNNWGVDPNYQIGTIQTWNATFTRDISRVWSTSLGYTGTKGTDLDILRAPNRGPLGLTIPDVQAFTWESSGGDSILQSATFALRRRPVGGLGGGVTYTLARSFDNASSLGGGGVVVAQDDKNLAAEHALSSFDRRHVVTADLQWELPFGPNRRWLASGGLWAVIAGDWSVSANATLQSGTPFTARVTGAATDVNRGSNGSLRADYSGADIELDDPTIDQYFNTSAFAVPAVGVFGNSPRNTIIGPGGKQLNVQFNRAIRLNRGNSIQVSVNANNILNTVQWSAIDTNLNSPTFGEVTSVRPMRSVTLSTRIRF